MRDHPLKLREIIGIFALLVVVITIPVYLLWQRARTASAGPADAAPTFIGSTTCRSCHEEAYAKWRGSDHDMAMAEADDSTVVGDFRDTEITHRGITSRFYRREGRFFVWTEGPAGEMNEFEITHTFGFEPMQQYLVPFPGGRLQALSLAWDIERERWFHLYPEREVPAGDWLHWTRGGQNWNGMCAECHSTDLRKNYDPGSQTYSTSWSDIDVGCEACHGPGSGHVCWAKLSPIGRMFQSEMGLVVPTSGIESRELVELCAPCHSRRSELGDYDHTGRKQLDFMLPDLLREEIYHADGQILEEDYVYGSFLQSKMYAKGVRCTDCHDGHTLKLVREGNELCLQCHDRLVFDTPSHHFHKMTVDGRSSDGALCVKCHMMEQPYMVIDWRADHSFRIPRPDLSADIGTPNACSQVGCHGDKPLKWAIDACRKWYGEERRPHFGTILAAARAGDSSSGELARLAESALQPVIVRATALELLSRVPGDEGAATMEAALLSGEPLLRQVAAANLFTAEPKKRASLLAPLLSDMVKAVRLAALSQLAGLPLDLLNADQLDAFTRCLQEYEEAMAHSLDFPHSGLNLGNLYANLGRSGEAEENYRLALEIDDLFLPAKMNLAILLSGQGRNSEAELLLREAAEDYPDAVDPAHSLGLLLAEMGKPGEAAEWLRRCAEIDPRESRTLYNLGLLLEQLGRPDEARLELEAAVRLEPENLDYLYALAEHLIRRNDLAAASEAADRIASLRPELPLGRELKTVVEKLRGGR